ncbi:hypothetical protein D3C85_958420 [compost metagenome]
MWHWCNIRTLFNFTETKERLTEFPVPTNVRNVDISTQHLGISSAIDQEHLALRNERQFAFFKPLLNLHGFRLSSAIDSHAAIRETDQCYGVQINITHLN